MVNILCFGDSNTWGFIPSTGNRYPSNIRWTGKLQKLLGENYNIIEEGLSGRTTIFDDPTMPFRNGLNYITPCLLSHKPIDLIILMLGTNDTKTRLNLSASDIAKGMERLLIEIRNTFLDELVCPQILIVSPVPLRDNFPEDEVFNSDSVLKSRYLGKRYELLSERFDCEYLNAWDYVTELGNDNVHFTEECHDLLSKALELKIKELKF